MAFGDDLSHHPDTQRLEAFSDGVFAIAITLLIIEIGVPHVEGSGSLSGALRDLWPSYFGYAVSFMTIGIMWANHHDMFKDIERTDHTLLVLNLLLLMGVAFIPFPTAVMAEYLREGHHKPEAALIYVTAFEVIGLAFNAIWLYASVGRRLIDEHVSDERVRSRTLRYIPGPLSYAVAMPLVFVSYWMALGIVAVLMFMYLLPLRE
ncbi:MAG: TMEM175 family protein [Dehalococcoidia bacterium]